VLKETWKDASDERQCSTDDLGEMLNVGRTVRHIGIRSRLQCLSGE
jgi:hypothetical protein